MSPARVLAANRRLSDDRWAIEAMGGLQSHRKPSLPLANGSGNSYSTREDTPRSCGSSGSRPSLREDEIEVEALSKLRVLRLLREPPFVEAIASAGKF